MSVSLSSLSVVLKDRSYPGTMLKGSPLRGFYPGQHPHALPHHPHQHYMDLLPRTHGLLHPLKSLGRLVSDTPSATLPLSLHGGGHAFGHHVAHDHMLSAPGLPYLGQVLPGGTLCSKPEELAAVVTEHAAGPLSSDFSSPSSDRSPSASSSFSCASSSASASPKDAFFRTGSAELTPEKTRARFNFSEEDLFTVLYGYSGRHERSGGHAISGVALPEKPGERVIFFR